MLLQVASVRSGVTGRFLRATRPTAGPTPVEAPVSAVTRSGANRSDAGPRFLEGNRSDTGRRSKRNRSDAGGRSLERTAPTRAMLPRGDGRTQAEASSRRDRSDAGRGFLEGEPVRCSSTVPQWGPVERGPPLPQKANRSDAARGFLEGTGRTQAEASSREPDRRRSTRLAKRRVTLRCGRDGRLAAGGSQASAGSSGAPAGTSAGARACGPSAGPAGAPPGRRSARHGGHAGSGPKRPSSGLRERCRARGWRLTLALEQRCRGRDPAREGSWP